MGVFVGTGDQDNYVKVVVAANGGTPEVQVVQEVDGVSTVTGVPVDARGRDRRRPVSHGRQDRGHGDGARPHDDGRGAR